VFVVRRRVDLLYKVIPIFERNPLLSHKQEEFLTIAGIVRAMEKGEHLTGDGFGRLAARDVRMNGGGRYRRTRLWFDPESSETICRAPISTESGEDMVRPAWRHAEPARNALAPGIRRR
jgi:hypothetical protein